MKKIIIGAGLGAATAFAVHSLLPSYFHKWFDGRVVKHVPGNSSIMLTFDDGPDERYTGALLDLLQREQVPAVFFIVLHQADGREELIERMIREGHCVGFHSRAHKNAMFHSAGFIKKELSAGKSFLEKVGEHRHFYRPPWGLSNLFTWHYMRRYHMNMLLWSVMAGDWRRTATVSSLIRICRKKVRPGTILCLHDAGENTGGAKEAPYKTIKALEYLIPYWKSKGYTFVLPE